jgi:hypothetical protein
MFDANPFAGLADTFAPALMQAFVVLMIALVVGGTVFDLLHKRSATYFFGNWGKSRRMARKPLSGGDMASLLIQTAAVDVLTSGEFCNQRRRIAHLLGMYGFVLYAVSTVIMLFGYPTPEAPAPAVLPVLWHVGALMVCIGGYWFWFFLRVDVVAEGSSSFRVMRADLFVLSLVANTTLALIWSRLQAGGSDWTMIVFAMYIVSTVVLFGGVPWSKFSHMFYKPAAAFQKRVEDANGFGSNLPRPADKPAIFDSARRSARHY